MAGYLKSLDDFLLQPKKSVNIIASDTVVFTNVANNATTGTAHIKANTQTFRAYIGGTIRIKYDVYGGSAPSYTSYSQVSKNGIPIGTINATPSGVYITLTQDFICEVNDYFDVYYWNGTDNMIHFTNLKICFNPLYTLL